MKELFGIRVFLAFAARAGQPGHVKDTGRRDTVAGIQVVANFVLANLLAGPILGLAHTT